MIRTYHRPQNMEDALKLLAMPDTLPLGGGTILNQEKEKEFSVVDLQSLGLDKIKKKGNLLDIGATVTLSQLAESDVSPVALKTAITREAPRNLLNMGTIGGTLVVGNGRSPFITALLSLDAKITLENAISGRNSQSISLGDLLTQRMEILRKQLITHIEIPLSVKMAFETVARSPRDKPLVCAALTQWSSGRTRLALGGWGDAPLLAFDGNEQTGINEAARNAYSEAGDEWASPKYRSDIAAVLATRCLKNLD
jgi:putative selenate reductase FAD-binding subunit